MPINNLSQALKMRNKLKAFSLKAAEKSKKNFIYNKAISFFK